MTPPRLLSPKQVADLTTLAESTLADWRAKGSGPTFIRLGRRIGYPEAAVTEWLAKHTEQVAS